MIKVKKPKSIIDYIKYYFARSGNEFTRTVLIKNTDSKVGDFTQMELEPSMSETGAMIEASHKNKCVTEAQIEMSKPVKRMIKEISSAYVRADRASRSNDCAGELKHLLTALHSIVLLLRMVSYDRIDSETANRYAQSLVDSAKRIRVLVERGGV